MRAKCQLVVGQRHTFGEFIPNMALFTHSAFVANCCSLNQFLSRNIQQYPVIALR